MTSATAAHAAHPERFVRGLPHPPAVPSAVWINPPTVSGERIGGAEVQPEYLATDLDRTRYEPLVLAPARGSLTRALADAGVSTAALAYPHWRRRTWLDRGVPVPASSRSRASAAWRWCMATSTSARTW